MSFRARYYLDRAETSTAEAALRALLQALALALFVAWLVIIDSLVNGARAEDRYPHLENPALTSLTNPRRVSRSRVHRGPAARDRASFPLVRRGGGQDETCLPASIRAALDHVRASCGAITVLSTLRPHARVPTGHVSLHAACQAADFSVKNYACAYAALADWRFGLSLDGPRMRHIHISAPGLRNEGQFYHHAWPRTIEASAQRRAE